MKIVVLDCETTGLPRNYQAPVTDLENWPRAIQIAWGEYNEKGTCQQFFNYYVWSLDISVPPEATAKNGITDEMLMEKGVPMVHILDDLVVSISSADYVVAHNINFDASVLGAEFLRDGRTNPFEGKQVICTMQDSTEFLKLGGKNGGYKWPKLSELYYRLFPDTPMLPEHDAANDVTMCAECFFELVRLDVVRLVEPIIIPPLDSKISMLAALRENIAKLSTQKEKILAVVLQDALYVSVDAQLKEVQGVAKLLESEIRSEALKKFEIDRVKKPGTGWQVKCFEGGKLTYDPLKALNYCMESLKPALTLDVKTFEGFAKSGKLPETVVKVEDDYRVQIDTDLSQFLVKEKYVTGSEPQ